MDAALELMADMGGAGRLDRAGATAGLQGLEAVGANQTGAGENDHVGFATAGQVVTTTDNQTMTLNECAGMWLIAATQAPCLVVSNTAVTGAPAVLTVYGPAPTTDAGTYKILRAPTPAGTVASHTHTAGAITVTDAGHAHT